MTVNRLRLVLRLVAVLAGVAWAVLGLRALVAPESHTAEGVRAWAFITMMGAAFVAWPYRHDADGDGDETL